MACTVGYIACTHMKVDSGQLSKLHARSIISMILATLCKKPTSSYVSHAEAAVAYADSTLVLSCPAANFADVRSIRVVAVRCGCWSSIIIMVLYAMGGLLPRWLRHVKRDRTIVSA